MTDLTGRCALITGAASGIGAACAERLARAGATLHLTDVDDAAGAALADRLGRDGTRAQYHHLDVTQEDAWQALAATLSDAGVDILIANAGIGLAVPSITEMRLEDWRRQIAVNLDGVFLSVKHILPLMRAGGRGGSIVMMSSVAGLRGSGPLAGYCATKGGVRLFAKSVAQECALADDGVRVNSVHPGIIDTPIWDKIAPGATVPGSNRPLDGATRGLAAPIGRAGTAAEVADAVHFLCSDASRYMTGSEVVVDGGMTAVGGRRA